MTDNPTALRWNVKFYERDGGYDHEYETVRGLSYTQMHALMSALDREGVWATAYEYWKDGEPTNQTRTVNKPEPGQQTEEEES